MGHETRIRSMAARRAARWARIKALVDASIAERLTVADLAEIACLSPFHFSREFQKALGMPPHAYLTHRRLVVAQEMIAQGAMSLGAVAKATGFMTPSHFSNVFKRQLGITPSTYRKGLRGGRETADPGERDLNMIRQPAEVVITS